MTCSFDYIEDSANNFTPDQVDTLTDEHVRIARILYRHRYNNKDGRQQVFKFSNGKLIVVNESQSYKEAQALINTLNTQGEVVKLVVDPSNTLRSYVSIDVRPLSHQSIAVDEGSMSNFMRHYFGDSAIVVSEEAAEVSAANPNHSDKWNELTDSVRGKVAVYLKSLENSSDRFGVNRTEQELKELLFALNDRTTSGLLESISKYITDSGHNLNNLRARLAIIDQKIKNLDPNVEIRKQQIKEVSDFVRHSSYYYHLFDILEDISGEFQRLGIQENAIDNYERDILEDGLKKYLQDLSFDEQEIQDFLDLVPAALGNDVGGLFTVIKDMYKSKLGPGNLSIDKLDSMEAEYMTLMNDALKKDSGIIQQLNNTLSELRPFKLRLHDLHYDTLAEVYYPVLEHAYRTGSQELRDKYFLNKEDFKTLLATGEEDIDVFTRMGSAMINVNEVVANTIANYFKDMMIDVDLNNKLDIGEVQRFIVGKEQSALDNVYSNSTTDRYIFETIKEVDDTYIPSKNEQVVTFTMFEDMKKYVARKTRNLLSETDELAFHNLKMVFYSKRQDEAITLATELASDPYALMRLQRSNESIHRLMHGLLYYQDKKGNWYIKPKIGRLLNTPIDQDKLATTLKGILTIAFRKDNLSYMTDKEVRAKMDIEGIMDSSGNLVDLNDDKNLGIRKKVRKAIRWDVYKDDVLDIRFSGAKESLFGIENGNVKRILVQLNDKTLEYVDAYRVFNPNTNDNELILDGVPAGKTISYFASYSQAYQKLSAGKYSIRGGGFNADARNKWNTLEKDAFSKTYFDLLSKKYGEATDNMGHSKLRFNELPQVKKIEQASTSDKVKNIVNKVRTGDKQAFYDYMGEYVVKENKFAKQNAAGEYLDEEGNVSPVPVYQTSENQYINGQRVREIDAKFTRPIDLDDLESDLYKSILLYKTSSNMFKSLKDNESQALLLQSVVEGDSTLGIEARKMKIKKIGKNVKVAGGQVAYKQGLINTSKMIVDFINDYVYNETTPDYAIPGTNVSVKKVAEVLSGYTAFTSLALNLVTMPSNAMISLHNTRTVAKGNQFFNAKDWKRAIGEYYKSVPSMMKDFTSKGLTIEKSPLSQMIIRFNAIQGEFISPYGELESKNLGQKLSDSALWWTQSVVEHGNQTQSMIMMMMGYKLPSGTSLWDAIQQENAGKTGELLMPQEFTRELELEFQKRLQAVNLIIHGNYSKLDRNELQKGILTNMFMMFRKYIYDGFRSRFQSERPDIQTATVQEGFFRTYLKQLNEDLITQVKTQGLTAALAPQLIKGGALSLLKTTLSGVDSALGRVVTRNNEAAANFLHGTNANSSERQRAAAIRSAYEIGNVIRMLLVIAVVQGLAEGLDDDDEEMKFLLSYAELYARKLESDIGFFTSFTNIASGAPGFTTLDQVLKIARDPFVAYRSMDNTVGLFKQLTSFDAINEDGEYEFKWGAFEQYQKSGSGYTKGDYKVMRKLQKSVLSPWYQVIKALNPEQQVDYMNLVFKYSK